MAKTNRSAGAMQFRSLVVSPASLDVEKRSVEAVFATESPVVEYDYERGEYVPTVILMSGCQLPKDRSLVMLDNHRRHGAVRENIKGSGNNCRVENRQLVGTLVFSSLAEPEWTLAREGNLKAVSIGRTDNKGVYVPDGQSVQMDGLEWEGPVRLVTSWTPREISLTPIGADRDALLRSEANQGRESDDEPNAREQDSSAHNESERGFSMNAILKALLVSRAGLKKDASDEDAVALLVERGLPIGTDPAKVDAWVTEHMDAVTVTNRSESETSNKSKTLVAGVANVEPIDIAGEITRALKAQKAEELAERAKVRDAVVSHLKARNETLKWDDETVNRIAKSAESVQDADNAVFEEIANRAGEAGQRGNSYVSYGQDQADKVDSLLKTALSMRTLQASVKKPETIDEVFPKEQRFQGWEQYRHAPILQLARVSLEARGVRNVGWMSPEEIAKSALFGERHPSGFRIRAGAYHTPGSFPYILLDAINKNMMAAYSEAPSTCEAWVRVAPSVPDFKNIHVIKLGAMPNLQDWDGYSPLSTVSFKDEKETYAVQAKAERVPLSWMAIVNDDQNALSGIPAKLGAAARRTRNQMAYAQIATGTSGYGRTMSDGQQLFSTATGNRAKSNLSTGAGAPSVTTVQTQTNLMMQMRGLNSPEEAVGEDILGLQPAFIIGPSALRTTILQLVRSTADPASGGNAGVYNPTQGLVPIIEPYLDGQTNGTTAWYLASRWQDCEHVQITHLAGQETPVIESWVDDSTKALMWDCTQTMAACAVEHRGIVKHVGA